VGHEGIPALKRDLAELTETYRCLPTGLCDRIDPEARLEGCSIMLYDQGALRSGLNSLTKLLDRFVEIPYMSCLVVSHLELICEVA
jgi:hypothetical protein